jgi:hypothetical protein
LDTELEKYYEGQFDLFLTKGWKDILEDLQKLRASISDITTVADAQTLHYRQGQIDIIDLLLNRKAACDKAYEELKDEENV